VLTKQVLSENLSRFFEAGSKIRLRFVKTEVENGLISHDELLQVYTAWVQQDEYLVLANPEKRKFLAVKCSKRGNDVYNWRIENRFKELDALASVVGNDKIFDIHDENPQTNVLFVTFTYDTKRCNEAQAWENIGIEFNRAVSHIKRKFPNGLSILRAWEGFENGYPHIHALLIFHEDKFDVFEHWVSDNKSEYRIKQKHEFDESWHSWIDVKAVSSVGGAIRYITKYLRKTHGFNPKYNLTQAQMWIHEKQSFSMSDDFVSSLRLVSGSLHNSNKKLSQTDLFGNVIDEKWLLVGIFSKAEIDSLIDGNKNSWVLRLKSLDGLKIN
jgi:hypothetical protein